MDNMQPCILVLQNNFLEIYEKLKEKYQENISKASFTSSNWIYTNPEHYLDIIKNSKKILGKQNNSFNVSKTKDGEFLLSKLGMIAVCYFECKNQYIAVKINEEISNSLSTSSSIHLDCEQIKPIPTYVDRKGHFYQISIDAIIIENYNDVCEIIDKILEKYSDDLKYTTSIVKEENPKQKILKNNN